MSVWKPKEPELTPEQAIEMARKELTPNWIGSRPLFACVKSGMTCGAYALDPEFHEKSWLIFFLDPTFASGERTLAYAKEWQRRYSPHGLGSLLIHKSSYPSLSQRDGVEEFVRREQIVFPVVIDNDSMVARSFGAKELPHVLLFSKGGVVRSWIGQEWSQDAELELQRFLRSAEPGLALLPVFGKNEEGADLYPVRDVGSLELGEGRGVVFPRPGFNVPVGGFRAGSFDALRPAKLVAGAFFIRGKWIQDGERIATSDPAAEIGFVSPTAAISVVAQTLSRIREPGKIVVEVGGGPAFDSFTGEDLGFDDEGQSHVKVGPGRPYSILTRLPEKEREITLRFPHADRVSVTLFAIRFIQG